MEWKPIIILVSDQGDVKFQERIIKPRLDSRGYQSITLQLHRMIAEAFCGSPPTPKHIAHHIDAHKRNNTAANICWLTQAENTRLHFKSRPQKLSPQQVMDILSKKPISAASLVDLARAFNVSYSAVRAIRSGINWTPEKIGNKNRAILTLEQVKRVREWQRPIPTAADLAIQYRVSKTTILNIWHNITQLTS